MSVDERRASRASGLSIFGSILTKVWSMGDSVTVSSMVEDSVCRPLVRIFVEQHKICM